MGDCDPIRGIVTLYGNSDPIRGDSDPMGGDSDPIGGL